MAVPALRAVTITGRSATRTSSIKAVRFDDYGGIEVLEVRDVARPEPGPDQVLVAVRAAGINPSEAKIRAGLVREIFPATFPSGEGSDLAGVVEEVGAGVKGVAVGDEVIGYTDNRASHAEYVLVEAANLTAKPAEVPWEVAGALFVAGVTGVATVRAVAPTAGEAVVIAGAGGGVGVFAVQLAVRTGARVIALASERHHAWLRERGAVPVAYGDGVSERITAAAEETPVAAFIDLVGGGYVELALELGIAKDRIDTIVDFPAIEKYGVKGEGGAAAASAATLAELAEAIAAGDLVVRSSAPTRSTTFERRSPSSRPVTPRGRSSSSLTPLRTSGRLMLPLAQRKEVHAEDETDHENHERNHPSGDDRELDQWSRTAFAFLGNGLQASCFGPWVADEALELRPRPRSVFRSPRQKRRVASYRSSAGSGQCVADDRRFHRHLAYPHPGCVEERVRDRREERRDRFLARAPRNRRRVAGSRSA